MSEYQYVAFRAIDKPLTAKGLAYMRSQSSRAEITNWSFDNEYQYGDFRGNALEMLRRGFDFHLHFADFGIRRLMIRLPNGLPDEDTAKQYFSEDTLVLHKDKQGRGVILDVTPYYEPGELGYLADIDGMIQDLMPLRSEIIEGDLRPLYLAHLATMMDQNHDPEESHEGPVPLGLKKLTAAQLALAEFYDLDNSFLSAVSQDVPDHDGSTQSPGDSLKWIQSLDDSKKDDWLNRLIGDSHADVRLEIAAEFRSSRNVSAWPIIDRSRKLIELIERSGQIQEQADARAAKAAEQRKKKRLATIAENPDEILGQIKELVSSRSYGAKDQIAKLLSDLRDALAGTEKSHLADEHAEKLKVENPHKRALIQNLRKAGFLSRKK